MKTLITGGAGFLGDRLARALLSSGEVTVAGETSPLTGLTVVDRVPPRPDLAGDHRVTAVVGDLGEALAAGVLEGIDLVFHLAAVVSSEAERDFDLGMRVNLAATMDLLEACRAQATPPRLVFTSSLAVFGSTDALPLPPVITDETLPTPQSSYGIQKFIGEQLVADYARRGLVPARTVRLMTVAVRPGAPNAAASSFLSGIVREPLAGVASNSPVPPETLVALSSPGRTVDGLLLAAAATDADWGPHTALTLPALTVSVGEMVAALERVAGPDAAALVGWEPDEAVARIVTSWPSRFDSARARRLGLTPDPDFDTIVGAYLDENGTRSTA
ncbi:D-erythronate dehydrogenase [Herbiconiux sp. A18JL235]|uniref:D-erythronate dehydrogenase n=1 Tax=Herbiconiux sp. A18JL235 TaxID=3152363 RepID=A0AB39BEJ8_9MICO